MTRKAGIGYIKRSFLPVLRALSGCRCPETKQKGETMGKGLVLYVAFFVFLLSYAGPVSAQPLFSKSFLPSTIGPGSVSTLTFLIVNEDVSNPVSDLAFTDNLPAGVVIASPANAMATCTNSVLTAPEGGAVITLSGGRLGAAEACIVAVNVTSSSIGTHTNVSGDLTSSAGNSGPAIADLIVDTARPGFRKGFSPASISVGQTSALTFTIDNILNASAVDGLTFADVLPAGMVIENPSNAITTCTGGALPPVLTADPGTSLISLTDGYVPAFSACSVTLTVTSSAAGMLGNVTGILISAAGDSGMAGAVLDVQRHFLVKSFTNDPVLPGHSVTLEFTITNFDRFIQATNISFTDDLNAALPGLAAVGLPLNDVCGPGSQISGTGLLTFSGGNLAPEDSCTFSVTLQVPAGVGTGTYTNTTSQVSMDVGGAPATEPPASDTLTIFPPLLAKSFIGDPVAPGGNVALQFTLTNSSPVSTATNIAFTDDLGAALSGLAATGLPLSGVCGPGSQISGTSVLTFTGGSLAPGASCTFSVTLQVPSAAAPGDYANLTSAVTADIDGTPSTLDPATDTLSISTSLLTFTKSFTGGSAVPGGSVGLAFTLTNLSGAQGVTGITFTDDLNAALPGLVAVGLPLNDICGPGSQISGTGLLTFTGGSLAPGASCTFTMTLQIPLEITPGTTTVVNTTSQAGGSAGTIGVTGNAASDTLLIYFPPVLSKSFAPAAIAIGGTSTLSFIIDNNGSSLPASGLSFTDNLPAGMAIADPANASTTCTGGTLTAVPGAGVISYSGGTVAAGNSCTVSVNVTVVAPGTYNNTTGNLTSSLGISGSAADTLQVNAAAAVDVPALNGWGMIFFTMSAGLVSIFVLRKRRRNTRN
jgi:uncharacterized repeat protein (TIGR01451 family)